jgi:uncharacterized protein YyaL (SSP411 family)
MAHESFEDDEVAALLNRNFVCIKVDREERPDIDAFYMAVSQALTGGGGWPLNIFLTPDKRPFMSINYLPKQGRNGMSGIMELLSNIAMLWRQRPDMIEKNCQSIMDALGSQRKQRGEETSTNIASITEKSLHQLKRIYDPENGGFGRAPKFPMPIYLSWLIGLNLPHHHPNIPLEGDGTLQMALHTLRKMRSGGIWDQLGGGVHRYSVDSVWLAPHFEKMLYDQAMMVMVTTKAFQATADPFYREMMEDTILFVLRELQAAGGAFCSALDADSEGVEGKFYVWDKSEIDTCLGSDIELFCQYYSVTNEGNFEGKNILTVTHFIDDFCLQYGLNREITGERLEHCRTKLLELRDKRIRPLRDDKIITSWNGLMISALATAGIVCSKLEHIAAAEQAATFILRSLRRADGRLLRSYLNGASKVPGFLEDYAFFSGSLLDLFEATLDKRWLAEARQLAEDMLLLFRDKDSGEFILTGHDAEQMTTRVSSDHDGVTPSALARTAHLLYRLAWIDDRPELLELSRAALAGILSEIQQNPLGHLGALQVLTLLESEPAIALFAGNTDSPDALALNSALHNHAIKNLIIRSDNNRMNAFSFSLCTSGTCYQSISTVDELERLLQL